MYIFLFQKPSTKHRKTDEDFFNVVIKQSVIKGYHAFKIRPPMTTPSTQLRVDLEYTNIKDPHASLIWVPDLDTFPPEQHDMITDESRHLTLRDIAGKPLGHAPWGLSKAFRQVMEAGTSIYAEPTGEPCQSFPPWPAVSEKGGGIVIPCTYAIRAKNMKKADDA
jgi:hypothetical protein